VSDEVTPASSPAKSWLRAQLDSLPPVVHTVVVCVLLGVVAWAVAAGKLSPSVVVNNLPALALAETATPPMEVSEGRFRPGHQLFCRVVRKRAAEALVADGFNAVGGNPTPLSKAKAEELLSQLDDATVINIARTSGAIEDGKFLDRLDTVLKWIVDHREQIMTVVKLVLSLLALFADVP
jgi:hypothetical protein